MDVTFIQPVWAWLLVAVPLVWFVPSRPRTAVHGMLRTLLLMLAIAALTQPVVLTRVAAEYHAIVLDQSASVPVEARQRGAQAAAALAERLADRGTVTMVQFGDPNPATAVVNMSVGDEAGTSPLGDALALAARSIPRHMSGAVTLISDGLATSRDWGTVIDELLDRGIPVHALDLGRGPGDPFLAGIRSAPVRVGESATVTVDVIGQGDNLEVVLTAGGEVLARSGAFAGKGRLAVDLAFRVPASGFVDLTAELIASGDPDLRNNVIRHIVAVRDPVRMLYLGERLQGGAARIAELLGPGFRVDAPEPSSELAFAEYDLVVLDDLPARSFPEAAQQALAEAVRQAGVGLFHSGGEAAFGDGGYVDSPIADILPVELSGDDDRVDPSVGLAIILDTSGSMAGTRIELAKQIARVAVRRMQPHDRIGIVEFYGNKHWAVPMQPASNKIEIDRAIGRMKAIGGTVLYPAIQEAYYGLRNVNTRFKHIVVITDAGVEDSNYEALIRRISKDRINVSTILVGQGGHNLVMSDMANWGQGRFYAVGDQFSLVELILKQPSTKKPPRYRQGDYPVRALGGQGWWGAVDRSGVPGLAGYVETELRDGAEALLEEVQAGHPLLATWRYGLGRITAFMSEPTGAGTNSWRDWGEYAEFLGRVLARSAADNPPFSLQLARRSGVATLVAQRNLPDETLLPEAHMVDETGARLAGPAIEFREYAPGLFEADFPAVANVPLRVEVASGGRVQRVADAGTGVAGETQVDPARALDPVRLADLTGGELLTHDTLNDAPLEANVGERSFVVTRIWPWLLLAALAVYLGELLYRRWPRKQTPRRVGR